MGFEEEVVVDWGVVRKVEEIIMVGGRLSEGSVKEGVCCCFWFYWVGRIRKKVRSD